MPIDQLPQNVDRLTAEIAFSKIKGINVSTAMHLLGLIGSPEAFFTMPEATLAAMTRLDRKVCDTAYRLGLLEAAEKEALFIKSKSIRTLFVGNEEYPRRLRECDDAPAIIFQTGTCGLDAMHVVSIVGTRHATPYGIDFVKHLVTDLAAALDSVVIISGLAYGIDVAAHKAALDEGVPTAAVVAHGLNMIYPADHRAVAAKIVSAGGAIVTEYTTEAAIHRSNFLARNRIVAGMADATIVVESDCKGGAMSTARIASAYGREVMAVPGRTIDTYSRGCNELIANQTATIIRSAEDLIEAMNWTRKPQPESQTTIMFEMTPEQKAVAEYIETHPDHTLNDICVGLGMSVSSLSSMLFEMEMADMIITIPGGRYAVTGKK